MNPGAACATYRISRTIAQYVKQLTIVSEFGILKRVKVEAKRRDDTSTILGEIYGGSRNEKDGRQ